MSTAWPADVGKLTARTFALDGVDDIFDHASSTGFVWVADGAGIVADGIAAEVAPADAVAFLAALSHHRGTDVPSAAGPRAVGALPFSGPGRFVVPSRLVGREADGTSWCTIVEPADAASPLHVAPARPARFAVENLTDVAQWHDAVRTVLGAIERGDVEKVVLARATKVVADAPFDIPDVLRVLRRTQPGCVIYADDGYVGASPELLVHLDHGNVLSRPLAGTGTDVARLLASEKDAREHQLVIDAVLAALSSCGVDAKADGPAPLRLPDVTHLATTVTGDAPANVTALDLVRALHPTPAVGGTPRAAALALIEELEPIARGRYAGPCGWVDANGDGAFVVALRGAQISGSTAILHAGAGIVAGSDPDAEWAETQYKLEPMLRALVRP